VRYNVIKKACRQLGFKCVSDENSDWDIYWSDVGMPKDKLNKMKPHQRINHYPGMYQLGNKNCMARNIARISKVFPDDFKFCPKTWVLPMEQLDFKAQFVSKKKNKTFIVKPAANC
jgi:tubulin polyglutamylase TTLL6/13